MCIKSLQLLQYASHEVKMSSHSRTRPSDQCNDTVQPEEMIAYIDDVDTSFEDMPALEPIPENDDSDPEDLTDSEDPISRLCNIIMNIRFSGQRLEAFSTWIESGNREGLFVLQNAPVVEQMQLLRYIRTHWDSLYQMITRCIEMQLVSLHSIWTIILFIPLLRQSIPSWHDQEVISSI